MVLELQSPKFFWNIKRHVLGHKLLSARLENKYKDGSKMNKKWIKYKLTFHYNFVFGDEWFYPTLFFTNVFGD
jgi:hypothetical protein